MPLHDDIRTVAVVGIDFFSDVAPWTVAAARGLIMFAPNPEMHLVNVLGVPPGSADPSPYSDSPEERALNSIDRELATLDALGARAVVGTPVRVFSHVPVGEPAIEILSIARDLHADLIVLGPHDPESIKRLIHPDSVDDEVRLSAECPVFIVEWAARPRSVNTETSETRPRGGGPMHPRGAARLR